MGTEPRPLESKVFAGMDFSGADFRDVDLSGARITGLISGLTINEIEVEPLIARELDRRYPERIRMRSADPGVLAGVWDELVQSWAGTIDSAHLLPAPLLLRRVNEEWSITETLRHLVFVIDDWFRRTVSGIADAYWPAGLPPSFITPPPKAGIDPTVHPEFDEVCALARDRMGEVSAYLYSTTPGDLHRVCVASLSAGPGSAPTVLECLHNVLDEVWAHRRYAERDLETLIGHAAGSDD